jgi:2-dehydro-3-deoxyphosphogluconate aldolase/(4S)-4-hydroxy-2-oxoglutarate aldolase
MINQDPRPQPSLALQKNPIVAVLRARHARDYAPVVDALLNGGIRSIELTLSTEGVFDALPQLLKQFGPDADIGIGTITTPDETARALDGVLVSWSPRLRTRVLSPPVWHAMCRSIRGG